MNTTTATASSRQIKDLSGPRGWPLLGNMFQLKASRIHQDVEQWAREFGPLFRFRIGLRNVLVVSDHELLAAAMRDRPDGFRRSPRTVIVATELGLPGGVFSAEGEDWRRQRRMVMASFAPSHVRAYFPSMAKVALRLRGRWQRAARSGEAINLQADLMRFTVDTIAGLAFGKDINTLESGEDVIQRHLERLLPAIFRRALAILPRWRWLGIGNPTDFRGVWLTPSAVVNRRIWAGMRRDLPQGPPHSSPSTA